MKKIKFLSLVLLLWYCDNQRVLHLPEVNHAGITEVLDVSPAYVFYDESQPDSTLFNRKNLIGTTNWLVNVDKRLTLSQAIPHIQYLQNKRRKTGMHKNENAKNYFTCNTTSIGNLGFIEFTDVVYKVETSDLQSFLRGQTQDILFITCHSSSDFTVQVYQTDTGLTPIRTEQISKIDTLLAEVNALEIEFAVLQFNSQLTFQNYIDIKMALMRDSPNFPHLSETEFIF